MAEEPEKQKTEQTEITEKTEAAEKTEPAEKTEAADPSRIASEVCPEEYSAPGSYFETPSACPICRREIAMKWQKGNIPYFGDIMFITSECDKCGFHFADMMILSSKDPVMYEISLKEKDDLNARVVRSTSGTIIIPEMGITIEPGHISESYITNIEGLLQKVRGVVESAIRWSEGEPEKIQIAENLLKWIDQLVSDTEHAPQTTVIIKDPFGNSAIIDAHASSRILTPEEAAELKTGMIILNADKDELLHDISEHAGPIGN
ncbi:ZPR1 zinc finger domain-containing protein [Methanosarcinaceae archaeon]|nr:ZPR1 zinc finger domain-containing protein [Methanosarcinaceae archaeon]MBQ3620068.1 ZPR1 zinc finger domain-containing protein [Methanosarcinaceae archaeon]